MSEKKSQNITSTEFLEKFNLEGLEFYDLTPYSDGIGFSVKKNFKSEECVSLISIYVSDETQGDMNKLYLRATYGKPTEEGIQIRSDYKASDPMDVREEEYFYSFSREKFFNKEGNVIDPRKMIREFYDDHIKSTKFFRGFWLRLKFWFIRRFLVTLLNLGSNLFYGILYLISGEKYSFNYIVDKIVNADKKQDFPLEDKKPVQIEGEKVDFYGYSVSKRSIVFYSLFHIIVYLVLSFLSYVPIFIKTMFTNYFLTIIYVIVSLWFFEVAFPDFCRRSIRYFSKMEYYLEGKNIKI